MVTSFMPSRSAELLYLEESQLGLAQLHPWDLCWWPWETSGVVGRVSGGGYLGLGQGVVKADLGCIKGRGV